MTGADCAVSCLWSQLCGSGALSSKADTTSAALKAQKHHSVRNWGALKSRTLPARAVSRRVPRTRIADSSLPVRQFLGSTFGLWESQTLWNHQTHAGASRCNSAIAALSTLTEAQAGEGASTARKVEKFWEWLKENGALEGGKPLVRIAEVPEGLGLEATGPIGDRDELFSIPEGLIMSVDAAKSSPVGKHLNDLPAWICLALFLLHEKANPESRWRPYLDILPEELDTPFFWEDDDLKELEGTQLLGSVLGYRQYIQETFEESVQPVVQNHPQLWPEQVASLEAFAWAFGIVRSRTHPPFTGEDIALVPLADLVNHGSGPYIGPPDKHFWQKKTVGFFKGQKGLVTMQPRRGYPAGEQITMDYGFEKTNSDLALDYGFVVEGGLGEGTRDKFQLTLEIPEDDRFCDDKLDIAEINDLGQVCQFSLSRGLEPSTQLLAFLRLIALTGPDAFLLESIFRNSVWEHVCLPISKENEEGICDSMIEGIKSSLSNYETTIEEDVKILGALDGDDRATRRKRLAVRIRLTEKRILSESLDFFENRIRNLDRIEFYAERRLKNLGLLDDSGDMTPWDEFNI